MIKVGILTSSRADFGIYLPLLKKMEKNKVISFDIIAFGTHLSKFHGYTINEILESGFKVKFSVPTLLTSDNEEGISTSVALCSMKFASFWAANKDYFDLVFCLGDRYEMFAAVSAGIPFGIKFAHLYGGDTSLGAIDDIYRDCLTRFASLHFTSTEKCAQRVKVLNSESDEVEVVGLLSLDDLLDIELLGISEFSSKWGIDLNFPTILMTFHPETVEPGRNINHADVVFEVAKDLALKYQLVITMPNADTEGHIFREKYTQLKEIFPDKVFLIENFGRTSYFSCLKHSLCLIGNSSSGISEAASFGKYVLNVGDRQKGREKGRNVFTVPYRTQEIKEKLNYILEASVYEGHNIYRRKGGVDKILQGIKNYLK